MNLNGLEQLSIKEKQTDSSSTITVSTRLYLPTWLKLAIVILLLSAGAVVEAVRLKSVSSDVWAHLQSGLWMLQSHSFPRTGLFSQNAEAKWIDLHWLFELCSAILYKFVGVRAIPLMVMCEKALLAGCVLRLARLRRAAFGPAFAVTGVALFILDRMSPLGLLSASLFALELAIIANFRDHQDLKRTWPIVPLFVIWAAVDSGFIYGVMLLLLLAVTSGIRALSSATPDWSLSGKALALAVVAVISTFISPYFTNAWSAALTELYSDTAIRHFVEMQSMAFRSPSDFIAMLFVMGTLTVLGLHRRCDLFQLGAIALAMIIGFRFPREFWLITLCCVATLADVFAQTPEYRNRVSEVSWNQKFLTVAVVLVILVGVSLSIPRDLKSLAEKARAPLPIAACDAIRSAHLQPPLFHSYLWGGFLTYYLPGYPVVTDTRVALYGEEWNQRYFNLIEGSTRLDQDSMGGGANTFLLEKDSGMAKAILNLPQLSQQFREIYRDNNSIVFVRK